MRSAKKPVFFIVAGLTLLMTWYTLMGLHTYYGDTDIPLIRGIQDIRWGIDIRGGVDVTFTPPEGVDASDEQVDAAKSVIETRMVAKGITDYEIYPDHASDRIIVRFPWQSGDENFDPEEAVRELGETAMLTFREGSATVGADGDPESLPLVLNGSDVDKAAWYYDTEKKQYGVSLELKESGKVAFADATGRLAGSGSISIWMDNFCFSSPGVNERIGDGKATISGNFTQLEAKELADKINGGALPYKLITDNFSSISPTFGEGARDAMGIAAVIAYIAIAIFMICVYRLLGGIAAIALLGQAAGCLAVLTGFFAFNESFTLTIPGIAGIILSIGMGVDANVITSERIIEELRAGKTLDGALTSGYKRAFSAIFDGNVTLIIVAVILMGAFGTPDSWAAVLLSPVFFMFGPSTAGAVYSFGFTLTTGAIMNFIFGVTASRFMTYSLSRFAPFRKKSLYMNPKGGVLNV